MSLPLVKCYFACSLYYSRADALAFFIRQTHLIHSAIRNGSVQAVEFLLRGNNRCRLYSEASCPIIKGDLKGTSENLVLLQLVFS